MKTSTKCLILIAVLLTLCFVCGCSHIPFFGKSVKRDLPIVAVPEGETIAEKIVYETAWIKEYASLMKKDNDIDKADKILDNTEHLQGLAKEVELSEEDYCNQIEEIKNSEDKAQKRIWLWIIGASAALVLVGSVIAFCVNSKMGLGLGLSGIFSFIIAYTMLKFAWILAVIGLVVFLVAIALVIMELIKNKGALTEIVKSFEIVKEKSFAEIKSDISIVQSPKTKEIVADIKGKLGIKDENTIEESKPVTSKV